MSSCIRTFFRLVMPWLFTGCILLLFSSCREEKKAADGYLFPYAAAPVSAFFTDSARLARWWPGKIISYRKWLTGNALWTLEESGPQSANLVIKKDSVEVSAVLLLLPLRKDSTRLKLLGNGTTLTEAQAQLLQESGLVLLKLQQYLTSVERVYGIPVVQGRMKDSFLMVKRIEMLYPPAPVDLYKLIDPVRRYVLEQGGIVNDSPMVYIQGSGRRWIVQAGISTNKILPETVDLQFRKMILGNNLKAMVTGGTQAVSHAYEALKQYQKDYDLVTPAIPFQILRTHRLQQPDSSRWVTEIILPVM